MPTTIEKCRRPQATRAILELPHEAPPFALFACAQLHSVLVPSMTARHPKEPLKFFGDMTWVATRLAHAPCSDMLRPTQPNYTEFWLAAERFCQISPRLISNMSSGERRPLSDASRRSLGEQDVKGECETVPAVAFHPYSRHVSDFVTGFLRPEVTWKATELSPL